MSVYLTILTLHNVSRWLVVIAAIVLIVQLLPGLLSRRPWTKAQRVSGAVYTGLMDWQLLLGLLLYFVLSPLTQAAMSDFGAAMRNDELRFFAAEHTFGMLVAVALAHVGSAVSRRAPTDDRKYRAAILWYGLSIVAMIIAVPWWRPLLPQF